MEDVDLFWIAGSLHGRFPLLAPPLRAAVDLALVDLVWKAYVRDAGPGDTGPLFSGWQHADHVLLSEDPRAGAVLAWLASRDGPLRAAATRLQRARGASGRRFNKIELAMLAEAGDVLSVAGVMLNAAPPVDNLVNAIITLREDWRFASAAPARSAEPGGAWAINLALVTLPAVAPQPGIVTREALRADQSFDRAILLRSWATAAQTVYERARLIADRFRDARASIDGLSKNARGREVIGALAALEDLRRSYIKRGWELSEAGTTLIMRQLVDLSIARSEGRGAISWVAARKAGPGGASNEFGATDAVREFDEAMAFAQGVLKSGGRRDEPPVQ